MTHSQRLALLIVAVLVATCKEPYPTDPVEASPFVLIPNSGVVGASVKIVGPGLNTYGNLVRFTNSVNHPSTNRVGDTITTRVPFGVSSGPLTVATKEGNVLTPTFTILDAYEFDSVTVTNWNLPPNDFYTLSLDICELSMIGIWHCWERAISGDTVTLAISVQPWEDNSTLTEVIRFVDGGANPLPTFIEMIIRRDYQASVRIDTVKRGVVKIQEWNKLGRIRGEVMTPLYDPLPFVALQFGVD